MAAHSIVEYLADHAGYRCGYCGSQDTNFSRGMWAHSMTCQDYQDLIDRGWRRSGKYIYKPTMEKMCCPSYTIRCEALKFKPTKSQKKILKKMTRYLVEDVKPKGGEEGGGGGAEDQDIAEGGADKGMHDSESHLANQEVRELDTKNVDASRIDKKETDQSQGSSKGDVELESSSSGTKPPTKVSAEKTPKPGLGADPNKPPCKKAKQLRLERKQQRLAQRQQAAENSGKASEHAVKETGNAGKSSNEPKSLEEFIVDALPGQEPKHRLEVRLVRSSPRSVEFQDTFAAEHAIYKKYQMIIHKDPPTKPTERQIKLVRSSPRSEEFDASFSDASALFAKYQMAIHKDPPEECDRTSFTRFLVDSPLQSDQEDNSSDDPECGYGSFHQQYWLDGKLIAVGVLDILPSCVSSVYLFYDPDYQFLNLGTYSALRELAFIRLLHNAAPSIEYYYMGYYIHSCQKMKYKGNYYPSFIACPEVFSWQPIEKCRPKLDANKYSRLDESDATDPEAVDSLDGVLVLHRHIAMPYIQYKNFKPNADDAAVKEYAGMVGKTCTQRILLYRS